MATVKSNKKKEKPRYLTKALSCPDGTRKYIRAKTQAELDRKVAKARMELGMGLNLNDRTTFAEFAQMWVDVYKRPNLRYNTVKGLLSRLNTHVIPYSGAELMRDITPADLAAVFSRMSCKAKSLASRVRSDLNALFTCAIDNGVILKNPLTRSIKPAGAPSKERVPLTLEQVQLLLAAFQQRGLTDMYTFTLIGVYTGMRRGEIMGLCWDCVDFQNSRIYVRRQVVQEAGKFVLSDRLKTEASKRDIPCPPILLAHLQQLRKTATTQTIFSAPFSALNAVISRNFRNICRVDCHGELRSYRPSKALLDFYVHPHLLRHTYATILFEGGLDVKEVQYLLGHSSWEETMEMYIHYMQTARRQSTADKVAAALPAQVMCAL